MLSDTSEKRIEITSKITEDWTVDKIKATDLDRISEIEFGKQTKLTVGESSV